MNASLKPLQRQPTNFADDDHIMDMRQSSALQRQPNLQMNIILQTYMSGNMSKAEASASDPNARGVLQKLSLPTVSLGVVEETEPLMGMGTRCCASTHTLLALQTDLLGCGKRS
eukprot:TRINITY_DN11142_c0_g1_i3.p1 TRINITY_DN11142_c0_g1~~TRINITY_DN11142_c0_g1_i3.p1  ORF type:complete len:114 (+),score=12.99 TRINITY_DN11142_c0_g1_i3:113-454(+)